jgi:hypothetical protein
LRRILLLVFLATVVFQAELFFLVTRLLSQAVIAFRRTLH